MYTFSLLESITNCNSKTVSLFICVEDFLNKFCGWLKQG